MDDFNIDTKSKRFEYDKLDEFCDLFNFTNLKFILQKMINSFIDLFLANTSLSFQKRTSN